MKSTAATMACGVALFVIACFVCSLSIVVLSSNTNNNNGTQHLATVPPQNQLHHENALAQLPLSTPTGTVPEPSILAQQIASDATPTTTNWRTLHHHPQPHQPLRRLRQHQSQRQHQRQRVLPNDYYDFSSFDPNSAEAGFALGFFFFILLGLLFCCCLCSMCGRRGGGGGQGCSLCDILAAICLWELCCDRNGAGMDACCDRAGGLGNDFAML